MRECWPSTTRARASSSSRSEGSEKMSGRATITSFTVMLSSSMALWIISSCDSGIWPNWRLAVTMSLSSSGEWMAPPRRVSFAPNTRNTRPPERPMKKHGTSQSEKCFHGCGDGQSDLLGALQGQRLRNQLAEDHVHVRDQAEGDHDRDRVGVDRHVRKALHELQAAYQAGHHGFANPAKGQADDCDAQLDAVDHLVEIRMQPLDHAGADASGADELLNAGIADADQGKFRSGEEGIGCHQEKDQKDPEQHVSDHGRLILTNRGQLPAPSCQ